MKTKLTVVAAIVLIIGTLIIIGLFSGEEERDMLAELNAEPFEITRPDVQPVPNTFSIMSPEEVAAAKEAELQAEAAALAASSTASTSATSTDTTDGETEEISE